MTGLVFALVVALASLRLAAGAITGQTLCTSYMCITGLHDTATNLDTYTLGPPRGTTLPRASFGWMAIGFGSQMSGTPMVIAWPTSDGNIILSQRQANNHNAPQVVSRTPRAASLLAAQSYSNATSSSISFSLPSNSDSTSNATGLIWAYGEDNPGPSSSAQLTQHSGRGLLTIALMTPLQAASTASAVSSSGPGTGGTMATGVLPSASAVAVVSDASSSTSNRAGVIVIHAILGALAAMLFVPLGILSARLGRGWTTSRAWFAVHGTSNALAAVLATAAFGYATANFHRGYDSAHRGLGLTFFLLIILQVLLGAAVHWIKRRRPNAGTSPRRPLNFAHVGLGLGIMGVGFGAVYTGMTIEWRTYSGAEAMNMGLVAGWAVIVGVVSLAYIAGLAMLPRQWRNEASARGVVQMSSPGTISQQRVDREKGG